MEIFETGMISGLKPEQNPKISFSTIFLFIFFLFYSFSLHFSFCLLFSLLPRPLSSPPSSDTVRTPSGRPREQATPPDHSWRPAHRIRAQARATAQVSSSSCARSCFQATSPHEPSSPTPSLATSSHRYAQTTPRPSSGGARTCTKRALGATQVLSKHAGNHHLTASSG